VTFLRRPTASLRERPGRARGARRGQSRRSVPAGRPIEAGLEFKRLREAIAAEQSDGSGAHRVVEHGGENSALGLASKRTRISPRSGSIDRSVQPRSRATGGIGARPSIISQNGPLRVASLMPDLRSQYVIGSGAPAPPPHHSPRQPPDAKRYLIVAAPAMHTTSSCEPVAPEQPIAPMILLSSTSGIPPREAMTSSSVPI
jgi:hypothetical protein